MTNVLAIDGVITGVVDWDDFGVGCRAVDLADLLFDREPVPLRLGSFSPQSIFMLAPTQ